MTLTSDFLIDGIGFLPLQVPGFFWFSWHGQHYEVACGLPRRIGINCGSLLDSSRALCFLKIAASMSLNAKIYLDYKPVILKKFRCGVEFWRNKTFILTVWLGPLRKAIFAWSMWFRAQQRCRVSAGFLVILKLRLCNLLHKSLFSYFRFSQHFARE